MTIRDPAENDVIHVPLEGKKSHRADGFENLLRRHQARYSPVVDDLVALYSHPEALPVLDKV
jgi:5,5'-dehydrodivanillate O-demethylase oxygenase subunit